MMLKISRVTTAALTANGHSMKKYIISFFLILYSGICMANDIQIRRYSPSLTIDSELSYPIYLAVNTAVNKSYDIKQYNISVKKGWEENCIMWSDLSTKIIPKAKGVEAGILLYL